MITHRLDPRDNGFSSIAQCVRNNRGQCGIGKPRQSGFINPKPIVRAGFTPLQHGPLLRSARWSPPHVRPRLPDWYWTLKMFAFSSDTAASYAVCVRRARILPAASFRFRLTVGHPCRLANAPPVGCVEGLHLQVRAPCRAHKNKKGAPAWSTPFFFWYHS